MISSRRAAYLAAVLLISVACAGPGGGTARPSAVATTRPTTAATSAQQTTAATTAPTTAATTAPSVAATGSPMATPGATPLANVCDNLPAGAEEDLLATICERDRLVAFTDPAYPPQSELDEATGEYIGFDIDVTNQIAQRLGISTVEFVTPNFNAMQAGNWNGRYDIAVGSVTITETRKEEALDFTQPYYYTPAQMTTFTDSGITSVDQLAGQTVCAGEGTTYFDWLDGTLTLTPEAGTVSEPPEGVVATTLRTDTDCAQSWRSGRRDFQGWLTAQPTAQQAVEDGFPVVFVGDPVFYEPLAVAFDKSVENNDVLVATVDQIIADMHADGTLTGLSEQYYDGLDLTKQATASPAP